MPSRDAAMLLPYLQSKLTGLRRIEIEMEEKVYNHKAPVAQVTEILDFSSEKEEYSIKWPYFAEQEEEEIVSRFWLLPANMEITKLLKVRYCVQDPRNPGEARSLSIYNLNSSIAGLDIEYTYDGRKGYQKGALEMLLINDGSRIEELELNSNNVIDDFPNISDELLRLTFTYCSSLNYLRLISQQIGYAPAGLAVPLDRLDLARCVLREAGSLPSLSRRISKLNILQLSLCTQLPRTICKQVANQETHLCVRMPDTVLDTLVIEGNFVGPVFYNLVTIFSGNNEQYRFYDFEDSTAPTDRMKTRLTYTEANNSNEPYHSYCIHVQSVEKIKFMPYRGD